MNILIYMLSTVVQQLSMTFYYDRIGDAKHSFFKTFLIMYAAVVGEYFITYFLFPEFNVTVQYSARIVINFVLYCCLFKGSILKKLAEHISCYAVAVLVEVLSVFLFSWVFGVDMLDDYAVAANSDIISAGRILAADVLLCSYIAASFVFNMIRKGFDKYRNDTRYVLFVMAFVIIHFVFLVAFYKLERQKLSNINNLIQLAFQALLAALVFIQYYNTMRVRMLRKQRRELEHLKNMQENNYRFYSLAQSRFDEISKLRHDLYNQLEVVRHLMNDENGRQQAENIITKIDTILEGVADKETGKDGF